MTNDLLKKNLLKMQKTFHNMHIISHNITISKPGVRAKTKMILAFMKFYRIMTIYD